MENSVPKYTHHKVQMNHDYEVKFTIKDGITDELVTDTLQNVYAKGISAMPAEDDMFNDIWRLTSWDKWNKICNWWTLTVSR